MKNKKRIIYAIIALILIILLIVIYLFFHKENYIEYKVLETKDNINSRCKTIFLEIEGDKYSFDNGLTWQKSNYYVVCDNKKYDITIKDENEKIIKKGLIKVKGLRKDGPKINIDFDEIEVYEENTNLLNGVIATNDYNKNLTSKLKYKIIEKTEESLLIEYTVEENEKITAVARKLIKEKKINIEEETTIKFEKSFYKCNPNEKIDTKIIPKGKNPDGTNSTVVKYSSSNDKVATITENKKENTNNCTNCINITIECKEEGKSVLYAESSTNANIAIDILVNKD